MIGLSQGEIFDVLREGMRACVSMAAPLLTVALIIGLVVGLFQALTSIQEMTLTFVPKLCVMLIVFWVSMSFMTNTLVNYFHSTIIPLISGG